MTSYLVALDLSKEDQAFYNDIKQNLEEIYDAKEIMKSTYVLPADTCVGILDMTLEMQIGDKSKALIIEVTDNYCCNSAHVKQMLKVFFAEQKNKDCCK
jgi:hypothetical protein